MSKLILKRLAINKAHGFPQGMESVDNIAANINIVAGPNASGKSTTARMIQKLIWRNKTRGLQLEGSFNVDGTPWEVKVDSDYSITQRDGRADELPGVPEANSSSRYYLALHELIIDDEGELAKEIMKQSIGGFDLKEAAGNLKYNSAVKNKRLSEYVEFCGTNKAYLDVLKQQSALRREQQELASLYEDKLKAEKAAVREEFYELVVAYIDCKLKYEFLTSSADAFPDMMKNIKGGEVEFLEEQEDEIAEAKDQIGQLNRELEAAEAGLVQLRLPDGGISAEVISELEQRIDELIIAEREIKKKEAELEENLTAQKSALARIESIEPGVWNDLEIEDVRVLDQWLQETFQIMAEKEALEAQIKLLKDQTTNKDEDVRSTEKLLEGISHLGHWIKSTSDNTGLPFLPISLIAVFGMVAAFTSGWMTIVAAAMIGLLLLFVILKYGNTNQQKTLSLRQHDFERLGLAAPDEWTVEAVTNRVGELTSELKDSQEFEKTKTELKRCLDALSTVEHRMNGSIAAREEFLKQYGAAPALLDNLKDNSTSLYWFIQSVKAWHSAKLETDKINSTLEKLRQQVKEGMALCNELFETAGFQIVDSVSQGRARFIELEKQEQRRLELVRIIEQKRSTLDDQNKRAQRAASRISDKYKSLGVTDGDKEFVSQLEGRLSEYNETCKEHYACKRAWNEIKSKVSNHSLYDEISEALDTMNLDHAESELKRYAEIASKLTDINRKITQIETKVDEAMRGRVLEERLAEKEAAKERLKSAYENNLTSITGNILVEQLRAETQEQSQSQVFRRANQIFNHITNGRYELRLDADTFSAYDTRMRLGQSLSEISTGTRVQLLMAVRLAWVESNETTLRIPILADELLANSDEERAGAIIEALIKISQEGRQVFYFTAQADEVQKWQSYLDRYSEVESRIVLLSGSTGDTMDLTQQRQMFSLLAVPQPFDGESHDSYGSRVGIEAFDILNQPCEQLSLWYLTDDNNLLHDCLSRRINTWGQLASFKKHGGRLDRLSDNLFEEMAERMKMLEQFQERCQQGRHKRIDRLVLEKSERISDTFIDEVSEKLDELEGDPVELIEALRRGDIYRFRNSSTDGLEEYLITEGFISTEEPMPQNEISNAITALVLRCKDEEAARRFIGNVLHARTEIMPNEEVLGD